MENPVKRARTGTIDTLNRDRDSDPHETITLGAVINAKRQNLSRTNAMLPAATTQRTFEKVEGNDAVAGSGVTSCRTNWCVAWSEEKAVRRVVLPSHSQSAIPVISLRDSNPASASS
jgi:hypothetical protein